MKYQICGNMLPIFAVLLAVVVAAYVIKNVKDISSDEGSANDEDITVELFINLNQSCE
jgi:hypothetical protein